jgi:hypothetical protein
MPNPYWLGALEELSNSLKVRKKEPVNENTIGSFIPDTDDTNLEKDYASFINYLKNGEISRESGLGSAFLLEKIINNIGKEELGKTPDKNQKEMILNHIKSINDEKLLELFTKSYFLDDRKKILKGKEPNLEKMFTSSKVNNLRSLNIPIPKVPNEKEYENIELLKDLVDVKDYANKNNAYVPDFIKNLFVESNKNVNPMNGKFLYESMRKMMNNKYGKRQNWIDNITGEKNFIPSMLKSMNEDEFINLLLENKLKNDSSLKFLNNKEKREYIKNNYEYLKKKLDLIKNEGERNIGDENSAQDREKINLSKIIEEENKKDMLRGAQLETEKIVNNFYKGGDKSPFESFKEIMSEYGSSFNKIRKDLGGVAFDKTKSPKEMIKEFNTGVGAVLSNFALIPFEMTESVLGMVGAKNTMKKAEEVKNALKNQMSKSALFPYTPDYKGNLAAGLIGDLVGFGKVSKGAKGAIEITKKTFPAFKRVVNYLSKITSKNKPAKIAAGAASAAAEGQLARQYFSKGEDELGEGILTDTALIGGLRGSNSLYKNRKIKKLQNKIKDKGEQQKLIEDIRNNAHLSTEDIFDRAKDLGETALIPEIVGDPSTITKIQKNVAPENIERISNIKRRLNEVGRNTTSENKLKSLGFVPGKKDSKFLKEIEEIAKEKRKIGQQLYKDFQDEIELELKNNPKVKDHIKDSRSLPFNIQKEVIRSYNDFINSLPASQMPGLYVGQKSLKNTDIQRLNEILPFHKNLKKQYLLTADDYKNQIKNKLNNEKFNKSIRDLGFELEYNPSDKLNKLKKDITNKYIEEIKNKEKLNVDKLKKEGIFLKKNNLGFDLIPTPELIERIAKENQHLMHEHIKDIRIPKSVLNEIKTKSNKKFLEDFFKKHPGKSLTVADLLSIRREAKKRMNQTFKANSETRFSSKEFYDKIQKIIESLDKKKLLEKADKYYATEYKPLMKSPLIEMYRNSRAENAQGSIFNTSKLIEALNKDEKEGYLAKFIHALPKEKQKELVMRVINESINRKETGNPYIPINKGLNALKEQTLKQIYYSGPKELKEYIKELKKKGKLDTIFKELQKYDSATIGSRPTLLRMTNAGGNTSITPKSIIKRLLFGKINDIYKERKEVKSFKKLKKHLSQENLKYYLEPELIEKELEELKYRKNEVSNKINKNNKIGKVKSIIYRTKEKEE